MNDISGNEIIEREISPDSSMVALLNKSEIDMQIATAHKYPRSVTAFRKEVYELVTMNEAVADECFYALPRDGKMIQGPSARFAEILGSCWGNARVGARVVADKGDFIVSQGVFHDLQRNWLVTFEVERRVTGKNNKRYSADMIGVTGNAASSIALRNAVLKGIPKALWTDLYEAALRTAAGDIKTLATRRATLMEALLKMGITAPQVFAKLGIGGIDDIGLDEITILKGMMTAIKEGDTTIEQAFAVEGDSGGGGAAPPPEPKRKGDAAGAGPAAAPRTAETKPTPPPTPAPEKPAQATKFADDIFPPAAKVPVSDGGLSPEEEARWQAEMAGATAETTGKGAAVQSKTDTGELCSAGERAWLLKRIKPEDLPGMLAKVGAKSVDALTRVQFDALRSEVL